MGAPSKDIADLLAAESALGLTFATNLFVGSEPASPDTCVTIYDTTSDRPLAKLSDNNDYLYENLNVQVRVRANAYTDAYDLIYAILSLLHGRGNETWNGAYYNSILSMQSPEMIGWDEKRRALFVCNFSIKRT